MFVLTGLVLKGGIVTRGGGWEGTTLPQQTTKVGGTHSTGMPSCFFQNFAQAPFTSSASERENVTLSVNAPETNFHFMDIGTEYFPLPFSASFSRLAGTFLGSEFSRRNHKIT